MAGDYWHDLTQSRIARRRLLIGSSVVAAGAVFLAACGSSKSPASGSNSTAALLTKPTDESPKAVTGGKLIAASRVLESLDPIGSSAIGINFMMYSTLWRKKAGHLSPYNGDVAGDLAEKWEVSGDQQQI